MKGVTMNIDFLKPFLGDELFEQVSAKLTDAAGITLANVADGSYIPKAKFDDERGKARDLTKQVNDLTAQLNEAQKRVTDAAVLNDQITKLTQDVKDRDDRLASLSTDYEIKDALRAAKARDVDIVFGLLDRGKITSKDGKLLGADEQIKAIRDSKSFLFDVEEKNPGRAGFDGRQDIIGGNEPANNNAAVNNAIRSMAGRG